MKPENTFVKIKENNEIEIFICPTNTSYYAYSYKHRLSGMGSNEQAAIENLKQNIKKFGNLQGLIEDTKQKAQKLQNWCERNKSRDK